MQGVVGGGLWVVGCGQPGGWGLEAQLAQYGATTVCQIEMTCMT